MIPSNEQSILMIPAIALMIAVYGSGRLLNDIFKTLPEQRRRVAPTLVSSVITIGLLWALAILINSMGVPDIPRF